MKLSTKIFLPIILISALLISLTGCFGVPADDSPGFTPGSIKGTMARPEVCCEEPSESSLVGDAISPNVCDDLTLCDPQYMADWYAWANVEVTLTTWIDCEEVELASTMTDENGNYLFENVPAGKNYIITAICPEEIDFKVKDVAEEVVAGSSYNAGIADAESTVLALCLEGLGEICLDSDVLSLNVFRDHFKYDKVICEVCDQLAECLYALPVWVCEITELCPGFTSTGGGGDGDDDEPVDPCKNNNPPYDISLDNQSVVWGQTYSGTVSAKDDGIKDPLTYNWTAGFTPSGDMAMTPAGVITWNPECEDVCDCDPRAREEIENGCTQNIIKVTVDDGCDPVDAEFCIEVINTPPALFGAAGQVIADMEVAFGCDYTRPLVVLDPEVTAGYQSITFTLVGAPTSMSINYSGPKPAIYWAPVCADVANGPFSVILEVSDGCATVEYAFTATATNDPPKLFGANPQTIVDMVVACTCTYERNLVVLDADVPDCQTITFTLKDAPPNMSIVDGSPSKISWTPTCEEVLHGAYSVTLDVSDGCTTVSYPFDATAVNDEPEITSPAPITLDLGDEYAYTVEVEDGDVCPDGCQILTFALIEGPAGMTIAKTADCEAELTWTPLCEDLIWEQVCTGGDCSDQYKSVVHVKIEIDDGCCDPVYKEFDITVYTNNHAPEIKCAYFTSDCYKPWPFKRYKIVEGQWAEFHFNAKDDDDELTWEIVDHNLAGSLNWTDAAGKNATLYWDEASCGPITETKEKCDGCEDCEVECERFIIVRVTDNGCPQLFDEYCIDFEVWDCCPYEPCP